MTLTDVLAPSVRASFVALALALPASAQQLEPAEAADAAPATIPLSSLVAEAESAERFAADVTETLALPRELAEIEAAVAPELEARAERVATLAEAPTTLEALDAEAQDWRARETQLARWQLAATEQLGALEREIAELAAREEVWQRTREAARDAQAPREALARIEAVRTSLQRALGDARGAQRELVALQGRVAEQQSAAASALAVLAGARSAVANSLLRADSAPLWRVLPELGGVLARARAQLASDAQLLRAFAQRPAGGWLAQLATFAVLVWLASRVRRSAARSLTDEAANESAAVFARPFAAAALIALALTPLFHPQAPASLLALSRVLLIVPVLRLLPALAPAALRGAIVTAAALALLGELRGAVASVAPLERALFELELALAAFALVWLMRPARLALLPQGRALPRFLRGALQLALGALVVAFTANALGWSHLAHLLGAGTLRCIYSALVLYSASRVARASLHAAVVSEAAGRLRLFREHAGAIERTSTRIVNGAGYSLFAALALGAFGLWEPFARTFGEAWHFEVGYGSLSISLGDVLTFGLTIWAALVLARFTRFVLEGDVLARWETERGVAHAVARTAQYVVVLVGFFVAAAAAGIDMNKFTVIAGALGVGIGFGLQNIVNNFVSGLILLYERPIQVGDSIDVGGVFGDVQRIGVRSSTLRTWDGAEVIVPNATLVAERVTNWTLTDRSRRVDIRVGVAYGSDPRRVIELLLRCAREHPAALPDPDPVALLLAFGDNAIEFELRFWAQLDRVLATKSEIAIRVHDALAQAGIAIPFPQRDLHVRSIAPEAARTLRGESGAR